uniref:Secreted protein n=1 Tax=Angiostrongylus cantonensis TaxID=6313 RepID=A0A0K0CVL2_ANGCA
MLMAISIFTSFSLESMRIQIINLAFSFKRMIHQKTHEIFPVHIFSVLLSACFLEQWNYHNAAFDALVTGDVLVKMAHLFVSTNRQQDSNSSHRHRVLQHGERVSYTKEAAGHLSNKHEKALFKITSLLFWINGGKCFTIIAGVFFL